MSDASPRRFFVETLPAQFNAALALRPGDVDALRFLGEIDAIQRRERRGVR